jgi:hypothetical protein
MGMIRKDEDVVVESHGHKFVLRKYKHRALREIKNVSIVNGTIMLGSFEDGVIFHSLSSWDLTDEKGVPIPLNRENFDEFFPNECTDDVYKAAEILNALPRDEKNASSGQSAVT